MCAGTAMLVVPMCRYACSMPQYFQFTCSDTDATLKFHCSGALLAFALAIFDATLKIRNGHILDATLQTHAGALHAAQAGICRNGEKRSVKIIIRPHPGTEGNFRTLVLPGHHDVVGPHAVVNIITGQGGSIGEPLRNAALCGHEEDFRIAIVLTSKGDLVTVRGEARKHLIAVVIG